MAYGQHAYSDWNSRGKNQVKDNINLIYPIDDRKQDQTTVYLHSQDTKAINKYRKRNYFIRYFDK